MHFYDDVSCLQCGATHTEEGELLSSVSELYDEKYKNLSELVPARKRKW